MRPGPGLAGRIPGEEAPGGTVALLLNNGPAVDVYRAFFPGAEQKVDIFRSQPLLVFEDGYSILRSTALADDGGLWTTEQIPEGRRVCLVKNNPEELVRELKEGGRKMKKMLSGTIRPVFLFPCAGYIATDTGPHKNLELQILKEVFGKQTVFFGWYAGGEYGTVFPEKAGPATRYFQGSIAAVGLQ